MSEAATRSAGHRLLDQLDAIVALLQRCDDEPPQVAALVALRRLPDELHPADIDFMPKSLPPHQRLAAWRLVKASRDGDVLLEVSGAGLGHLAALHDRQRRLVHLPRPDQHLPDAGRGDPCQPI